nr:MAG TPA: hypothetical protein [Caudoviricetes sp.]
MIWFICSCCLFINNFKINSDRIEKKYVSSFSDCSLFKEEVSNDKGGFLPYILFCLRPITNLSTLP